jgi:hypothetical protein
MLMMLLPAPLLGPGEAERRLTLGICAAVGAAEIEQQVSDAEVQGGLAPLRIAQVFGTADAMAEQGRCRSREALNEAFDGFKAGRPDADELDKAFSHARLVARPPRGPSPGAPDRFEGTFLKLSGPRIPAVPQ